MEDIFVPTSSLDSALAGPLHTVTFVTSDPETMQRIFEEGYGLQGGEWSSPDAATAEYLGFSASQKVKICGFTKVGTGANIQVRVIAIEDDAPLVRPDYSGLHTGGATLSFPINDLRAHEERMKAIGIESTIGVKEMEFTSPTGETYISAEIVYKAPDSVFVMGVTRPGLFVPTGPIDPETGMGGASYSARCITAADDTIAFFQNVMGYEIRRDVEFTVGDRSALLMPEGTQERFIQGFAAGAASGYVVLMDHGDATKPSPAPSYGPPNRGIAMWTFATDKLDEIEKRATESGAEFVQRAAERSSPLLSADRTMILRDPDGFLIEIAEL